MAKFDLKFLCLFKENDFIKCEQVSQVDEEFNEHYIKITSEYGGDKNLIYLDKSTAIKFAKTLRTEINKITEQEVNNV